MYFQSLGSDRYAEIFIGIYKTRTFLLYCYRQLEKAQQLYKFLEQYGSSLVSIVNSRSRLESPFVLHPFFQTFVRGFSIIGMEQYEGVCNSVTTRFIIIHQTLAEELNKRTSFSEGEKQLCIRELCMLLFLRF